MPVHITYYYNTNLLFVYIANRVSDTPFLDYSPTLMYLSTYTSAFLVTTLVPVEENLEYDYRRASKL